MFAGMLWLDDDRTRSLEEKVNRAVNYYHQKYGFTPQLCLVNHKMLTQKQKVGLVEVRPAKNVLLNHFWVGTEQ